MTQGCALEKCAKEASQTNAFHCCCCCRCCFCCLVFFVVLNLNPILTLREQRRHIEREHGGDLQVYVFLAKTCRRPFNLAKFAPIALVLCHRYLYLTDTRRINTTQLNDFLTSSRLRSISRQWALCLSLSLFAHLALYTRRNIYKRHNFNDVLPLVSLSVSQSASQLVS